MHSPERRLEREMVSEADLESYAQKLYEAKQEGKDKEFLESLKNVLTEEELREVERRAKIIEEREAVFARLEKLKETLAKAKEKKKEEIEKEKPKEEEEVEFVFGGCTSAESSAAAPVAEDLETLFLIEEGTTSKLFEEIDPHPKYVFRIDNFDPLDFTADAIKAVELWPDVTRVATIGADYTWGRDEIDGFLTVYKKLNPAAEVITQTWPPLFSKDFTDHITTIMDAKPDLVVIALWGGDLVTFLTQATEHGLFDMAHAVSITGGEYIWKAPGIADGILMDTRYYFLYPPWDKWSLNKTFNEEFKSKFPESRGGIPGFNCNSSYVAIHALKLAIEKAYAITGGWPDTDDIISALENLMVPSPGGYRYFRKEDHQMLGYAVVGLTKTVPEYPFPILDPIWPVVPEVMAPPPGVKWKEWVRSWP
mgnify:CR=1 FL=1